MDPPKVKLQLGPLDTESSKVAEVELRETPEIVQESLSQLRKLLNGKHFLFHLNRNGRL